MLMFGEDDEGALQVLNSLIEAHPQWPQAYYGRAHVWRYRGLPQDSLEDANRAIELTEEPPSSWYYERGVAYAMLGQNQRALDDLDTAIYLDPESPLALAARAIVHGRLENFDQQRKDREKSYELQPSLRDQPYELGKLAGVMSKADAIKEESAKQKKPQPPCGDRGMIQTTRPCDG